MDRDISVLYYTSNREDPKLERQVMQNVLDLKGDMPLVSVSHQPMDFGHNICVGEHDNCYYNLMRQVYIGLQKIKTTFVITAEADFLHTEDYYNYNPTETGKFLRYDNVWIIRTYKKFRRHWFSKKGCSDGAQVVDVKTWITYLEEALKNCPNEWETADFEKKNYRYPESYYVHYPAWTGKPSITFKTGKSVNMFAMCPAGAPLVFKLNPWGRANVVVSQYVD